MAPKQTAAKIVADLRASNADIATIRAELARQGFSKSRISQVCPLKYKAAVASKDDEDEMPALVPRDLYLSDEAEDVVVGGVCKEEDREEAEKRQVIDDVERDRISGEVAALISRNEPTVLDMVRGPTVLNMLRAYEQDQLALFR